MAGILEVLNDSHLQDITLVCCDGQRIRTNRVLLSASSPYFRQALTRQGSELYLPGITSEILNVLLVFMFNGDIQVSHCLLPHVIHAATTLQIRGFQDACAMIPSFITGTDNYQEALDIKQEATQPSKKRKLEANDNILESGSASLFRPWSVTVASSKETVSHIHKPDAFKPLTPPAVEHDYSIPGSLDEFSTPVSRKLHPLPSFRTPMELLKSDPSSAAEILCGSRPLFDDSKDDTVVEYRDESDDEGKLVIDLK